MRLTVHTDYALRMLIYLALCAPERSTIQEIAEAYGISKNHLMKVAHELGRAGWVETLRGRGGGLRLKGRPAAIRVGAVVRRMEEDFRLVECFDAATDTCKISPSCRLKGALAEAQRAFIGVLNGYTLADLVEAPKPLARLLGIPGPRRRRSPS